MHLKHVQRLFGISSVKRSRRILINFPILGMSIASSIISYLTKGYHDVKEEMLTLSMTESVQMWDERRGPVNRLVFFASFAIVMLIIFVLCSLVIRPRTSWKTTRDLMMC